MRLVGLAVVAACFLVGCSAPIAGGALPFVQFVTDTPGVGDAALLEGEVVDHGGCLGVEADGRVYVPVFPGEMVARAAQLRPGGDVSLGGGVASWETVRGLPGVEVPGACENAEEYWLVVSP